ncbi:MAG: carboxypeptidase regulatory-like domain-containing protein [Verrucomicrobiota bacterium]|nr:carboxypeptidase regulatory-like domain-containing protein [Verrucomicrobiota bacterium]
MKLKLLFTSLLLTAGLNLGVLAEDTASISGTIKLEGKAKKEKPIRMGADQVCAASHKGTVLTRHYVLGPNNELANAFVYIKSGLTKKYPAPKEPVIMDQVNCLYVPYVMGVQTGQILKVKNSDPTMHNVNCAAVNNKKFNIGQPQKGMENDVTFDKQEVMVKFKCDVHPWMFGYVGVVEHPFFATTDEEGTYSFDGLPAGEYEVEVWHNKCGTSTQKISVKDGEAKTLDFAVSRKTAKSKGAASTTAPATPAAAH